VIESAGEVVSDLADLGILLDDETDSRDKSNKR
jgi:hypothetical protein